MPVAEVVFTESVNVPHWMPACSACGHLGPDQGAMQPRDFYVCAVCGHLGDAWRIVFRPTLRRARGEAA